LRALVVDDEPVARRRLVRMLGRIGRVEVIGEAGDGSEALERIRALGPDVVLLDIRMPGLDGLALASTATELPPIVFTTAYDELAVQAFEVAAIDYLLKPIGEARLIEALERVRHHLRAADLERLGPVLQHLAQRTGAPRIAAHRGSTTHLFDPREISSFRATSKYTCFEHGAERFLIDESLVELERRLAPLGFVLIHRSVLVRIDSIAALRSSDRGWVADLGDGTTVPVSRRRVTALRLALGLGAVGRGQPR
jgi:DNA-binding LytR/AlgR family response regulator